MSYCTRADLEARLSAATLAVLGDADQDGTEDALTVAQAIADVDALIDGALAVRWAQYIGATSGLLTMIAVDLVAGRVARGLARSTEIEEREAKAEGRLKAIAAGQLHPCPDGAEAAGPEGTVQFVPGRRVFGGGAY